jgi:hypothetical protein
LRRGALGRDVLHDDGVRGLPRDARFAPWHGRFERELLADVVRLDTPDGDLVRAAFRAEVDRREAAASRREHRLRRQPELAAALPLHPPEFAAIASRRKQHDRLQVVHVVPQRIRTRACDVDRIAERRGSRGQQFDAQFVAVAAYE